MNRSITYSLTAATVFFSTLVCLGDDMEILEIANDCDLLYCGSRDAEQFSRVDTDLGIYWYTPSAPPLSQNSSSAHAYEQSGADGQKSVAERGRGHQGLVDFVERSNALLNQSDNDPRTASTERRDQQPAAGGGQQPGQMGAAGQGGMGAGTGLPNMAPNNNRHNLKAGFLYRDDGPSAPRQNAQNGNNTVTPTPHMTNTSPNQDANAQANSGRDQKKNEPRGAATMGAGMMAGQSPNMTGSQFDGQNPRRQQDAPDGHEADGALSKIAKKLGMGGFFGASGSGGTSGQRAANPTQGSAGKRQDPAISKKASELRARKLLQAQFNKLKSHRQLASELEFGSSNSSLFVNMCHHYARYARQHQLPINYAGCPKP